MSICKPQRGFSLIELMVAILLSSLLLLGVLELYSNTSRTDRSGNELARIQESGRIAFELIGREARRVGYQGCVASSNTTEHNGIRYPLEALDGTATSLTFNYARRLAGGDFPNRDCDNATLEPYQVTFSNCGEHLCITAPDIGVNQQLVANTNFTDITYLQDCAGSLCARSAANADFEDVRKLQLTLEIFDSRGEFDEPRTITSVIDLRNRL
jgi:type IV pilus assembly protein PilW